jgi:hypothetical protein
MDYQIVHSIPGRIRVRIPLLAEDTDYAYKLQSSIELIKYVSEVRINAWARSLVVSYKIKAISSEAFQEQLIHTIVQIRPESGSPSHFPSASTPSSTLPTFEKMYPVTHIASSTVMETEQEPPSQSVTVLDDPWEINSEGIFNVNEAQAPAFQTWSRTD